MALDVLLAATRQCLDVFGIDLGEFGRHRLGRLGEGGRPGIERRRQGRHDWYPSVLAASEVRISVVPPPIPRIRMSRYWRSTSDSVMYPIPPNSCTAWLATHSPASTAVFFAKHTSVIRLVSPLNCRSTRLCV